MWLLLILIVQFATVSACYADNPKAPQPQNSRNSKPISEDDKRPTWKYKRDPNEFKCNKFKQFPNLADVPVYSGGGVQFKWGEEFPNAKGGKVYAYNFSTTDPFTRVWGFYKNVLSSGGWTIDPQYASTPGAYMSAQKGNESCNVTFQIEDKTKLNVRIYFSEGTGG